MSFISSQQLSTLIAFGVSAILVWLLSKHALVLDRPNHRSLHTNPTPRTGGIGVLAGVFVAWLTLSFDLIGLSLAVLVLMILSVYDDIVGISAAVRLVIHISAVAAFFALDFPDIGLPMLIVGILATTWMINLYNFMDGSDGLAAGMAIIGFGCYAFSLREHAVFGWAAASVAMASLGFLIFNFHPAKIFLGDSGSIPLGFLAAAFGYIGWTQGAWPWWYPVLVFSPFIVDASLTLAKRMLRRERVWEAHKGHYYQRLIRMGWGHRKTALAEYGLMLTMACLATLALGKSSYVQTSSLMFVIILYSAIAFLVDRKWARHTTKNGSPN